MPNRDSFRWLITMTNVKISSSVCRLNIRICTRVNLFNLRDNWTIHDFSRLFYSRAFIKIQHNWPILKSNPEIFENSRIFSNVYNFMGGALQAILIGSRYCSANRLKSETNLTATIKFPTVPDFTTSLFAAVIFGYIDLGDGCWWQNVLMTTCW